MSKYIHALLFAWSMFLLPYNLKGTETGQKYVFFLHNKFVELFDLQERHPEYGRAEYREILERFRHSGFRVISEKRPKDTDMKMYAAKVVHQIDSLMRTGVQPGNITVVGTSKGGYIAQYASTLLGNPEVNFVLIGCYQDNDLTTRPDIDLCGNILSIYEKTDSFGVGMKRRIETSRQQIPHFKEIELHTGLKHGFLYHPMDEWMQPAIQWATGNYNLLTGLRKEIRPGKDTPEKNSFIVNGDSLPYRLIHPENETPGIKYPLIVYLHGSGLRGNDNERTLAKLPHQFTDSLHRARYPCYILIPQCPANDAWVLFPDFPNSLASTIEATPVSGNLVRLIHHITETRNIDTNRLYLTGFSLGGEGTFDMLTRKPTMFACGVPIASVADTSKAGMLGNVPVWAFHGSADVVNPVIYSRLMVEAIRKQGGNPKYTEFKGLPHNCQSNVYQLEELWEWMFRQKK